LSFQLYQAGFTPELMLSRSEKPRNMRDRRAPSSLTSVKLDGDRGPSFKGSGGLNMASIASWRFAGQIPRSA
jgi:hypothetical protein